MQGSARKLRSDPGRVEHIVLEQSVKKAKKKLPFAMDMKELEKSLMKQIAEMLEVQAAKTRAETQELIQKCMDGKKTPAAKEHLHSEAEDSDDEGFVQEKTPLKHKGGGKPKDTMLSEFQVEKTFSHLMEKYTDVSYPTEREIARITGRVSSSPFIPEIEAVVLPKKIPTFQLYKGDSDPTEHMMHFRQSMAACSCEDYVLCRVFPSSLKEIAIQWFYDLPRCSVRNFEDLTRRFVSRFFGFYREPTTYHDLLQLTQNEGELLKDYFERFQVQVLRVPDISEASAIVAFLHTVDKFSRMYKNIVLEQPKTLSELRCLVKRTGKEDKLKKEREELKAQVFRVQQAAVEDNNGKRKVISDGRNIANKKQRIAVGPSNQTVPVRGKYSDILSDLKTESFYRKPKPLPVDPARPRNKQRYCQYHEDHGHGTDWCFQYSSFIDDLYKEGKLGKYLKSDDTQATGAAQTEVEFLTKTNRVGMIRVAAVGTMKENENLMREFMRVNPESSKIVISQAPTIRGEPQIAFPAKTPAGLDSLKKHSLIVTVEIGLGHEIDEYKQINKVMIDTGSSVDVMYSNAFLELGLKKSSLRKAKHPLYSFDGASVTPDGILDINVKVGRLVIPTEFYVLKTSDPYNAILGRTWLEDSGAVCSTRHKQLKFITPKGVYHEVNGDIIDTLSCNMVYLQMLGAAKLPSKGIIKPVLTIKGDADSAGASKAEEAVDSSPSEDKVD